MPSPVLDNLVEEDALTTSLNRYGLLDEPFFDSSQPFRFLDLPLEIRRLVYQYYFPQRGATLRIKRGATDSEIICSNPWHEMQAILSTCREIYQTAKVFSQIHSATLDLSHYTAKTGDMLPISDILSKIGEAGTKCSRLIISSEQPWNILEPRLFPLLSKVEVWDYSHWRSKIYIANSAHLAADFEGESRRLLRPRAELILANNKLKVPDGVVTEINLVCDVLVCVGPGDALRPRQDKLRHVLSFSDAEADGKLVKVDWVGKHDMGPLPLRFQMAPHMHEYCLHLREHEPELLDRAL